MAEATHGEIIREVEHVKGEVKVLQTEVRGELKALNTKVDEMKESVEVNQALAQEAVTKQTGQRLAFQYLGWIFGAIGSTVGAVLAIMAAV